MAATKPFSFLILLHLIISIVGKIVIKPAVFQITSQGGDGVTNDHEISFEILYKGFKSQQTLKFPTNINQCSMVDNKYLGNDKAGNMYCVFDSGKATLLPQAQELTIDNSDSYNSIHWNVVQHDNLGSLESNDQFTVTISSSAWKLSSTLCTPYEIRIAVEFTAQKKNSNCFSANLNLNAGIPLGPALLRKALGIFSQKIVSRKAQQSPISSVEGLAIQLSSSQVIHFGKVLAAMLQGNTACPYPSLVAILQDVQAETIDDTVGQIISTGSTFAYKTYEFAGVVHSLQLFHSAENQAPRFYYAMRLIETVQGRDEAQIFRDRDKKKPYLLILRDEISKVAKSEQNFSQKKLQFMYQSLINQLTLLVCLSQEQVKIMILRIFRFKQTETKVVKPRTEKSIQKKN